MTCFIYSGQDSRGLFSGVLHRTEQDTGPCGFRGLGTTVSQEEREMEGERGGGGGGGKEDQAFSR